MKQQQEKLGNSVKLLLALKKWIGCDRSWKHYQINCVQDFDCRKNTDASKIDIKLIFTEATKTLV